MLKIIGRANQSAEPSDSLTLTFEFREKSRQRVMLDSGTEAGLFLPRGTVLHGGDLLLSENHQFIAVVAALEPVSIATAKDPILIMRACYHLGNRHVNLQIAENSICYQQDYVLDEMVAEMGLSVCRENAPFEPESGAYHRHSHEH